ncbi:CcoQ/FixQ family Cbb3-type cytochrome c oxidase assembly chaperone [Colwellia sp. E2M01]|uniref:cbb3-type cytochrome oxidase subunit 3 n=1 Tax=Colwellia sp. E2M01 TaxID=2841561 RepID=UPI001C098420|nr:CcoQ/FixQ family Cbb3-type cytochrome c oxidase assembly chaperone [Colwellia sp. E2M01]MBU2870833.1 CcoQ/FixQ family Cbb3-type cytochrome c oxidase assembly chaperone [Colwellia sp. E2M01]
MDYGTLRGLFALLILALFIIIVIWSYSKKRRASFDEIANSILEEDNVTAADNNQAINKDSKQETNNNV